MSRFDTRLARTVAREFAASREADLFNDMGSRIRMALIDSWIMRRLRESHVADSTEELTASKIIEFRDAVAAELSAGVVPANTRMPKRAYEEEP